MLVVRKCLLIQTRDETQLNVLAVDEQHMEHIQTLKRPPPLSVNNGNSDLQVYFVINFTVNL